jgi:DNA-binding XRE family transcriptional regulator
MMEHKQENADPVARMPVASTATTSKLNPSDSSKNGTAAGAAVKPRNAEAKSSQGKLDFDEPDDGVEAPAHPVRNKLREYRIENMMSKAELARKAGLSVLTVARIEKGYDCRMDTKRKLLKALGLKLADRRKVFEDE